MDFNTIGVGPDGRGSTILLDRSLQQVEAAGISLSAGVSLTVCDDDGDESDPTWLVVEGVVGWSEDRGRWHVDYLMRDVRWEPRVD